MSVFSFQLLNNGSGKVSKVTVSIQWPYATSSSRYLLYMINEPKFEFVKTQSGQGQCAYDDKYINEQKYEVRRMSNRESVQ